MTALLIKLWVWSLASPLRNWLSHATLALIIALGVGTLARLVFGPVVPTLALGTAAAGGFYVLKEVEETLVDTIMSRPFEWLDRSMDAAFPAAALALLEGLRYVVR